MGKDKKIIFILGGSRSGKSRYALQLASPCSRKAFLATALPIDDEMEQRIAAHKRERGPFFLTVEEPYDLGDAIFSLPEEIEIAIVDCLTVWLGNLMYRHGDSFFKCREMLAFFDALRCPPCSLILVSNEVGLGIIPAEATSRHFRDAAGTLNQRVASLADEVFFMISGLPWQIKKS